MSFFKKVKRGIKRTGRKASKGITHTTKQIRKPTIAFAKSAGNDIAKTATGATRTIEKGGKGLISDAEHLTGKLTHGVEGLAEDAIEELLKDAKKVLRLLETEIKDNLEKAGEASLKELKHVGEASLKELEAAGKALAQAATSEAVGQALKTVIGIWKIALPDKGAGFSIGPFDLQFADDMEAKLEKMIHWCHNLPKNWKGTKHMIVDLGPEQVTISASANIAIGLLVNINIDELGFSGYASYSLERFLDRCEYIVEQALPIFS